MMTTIKIEALMMTLQPQFITISNISSISAILHDLSISAKLRCKLYFHGNAHIWPIEKQWCTMTRYWSAKQWLINWDICWAFFTQKLPWSDDKQMAKTSRVNRINSHWSPDLDSTDHKKLFTWPCWWIWIFSSFVPVFQKRKTPNTKFRTHHWSGI